VDGEPMFYIEGLTADGLVQLNSVSLKSSRTFASSITGGFLQRVRGGFVVETYELGAAGGLEHGAAVPFESSAAATQTLCFQLGADMPDVVLKNGGNDVAVSIHYRVEGPFSREYQSRRYFLTDEGCSALRAGQLIELVFRESHVAEITGVSLIPTGQVSLDLGEAFVTCSAADGGGVLSETGRYSFAAVSGPPMTGVIRRNVSSAGQSGAGTVQPLYLRFATGSRQDNAGAGIDSPVSLTLGCYGSAGSLEERTYADIRPYIQNAAHSFPADEETLVVILVEDVQDIRWMDLTVQPSDGGQLAIWNLSSVTLRLGDSGQQLKRELTESIPEGETRHLSFANVYISGEVTYPILPRSEGTEGGEPVTVHVGGGELGVLLGSGQGIRVEPAVSGSAEGFKIELLSLEPTIGVTGKASLAASHSYTERYLEELKAEAEGLLETGSENEAAAARRILEIIREMTESKGSFTVSSMSAAFMAPRNFTGSSLYYRIIVSSVETGSTAFTVDLTVQNEADPLSEAISALRTVQNNELLQKMNEGISSINIPGSGEENDTSGGEGKTGEEGGETAEEGSPEETGEVTGEGPGEENAGETPVTPEEGGETAPESAPPEGDGTEGGAETP